MKHAFYIILTVKTDVGPMSSRLNLGKRSRPDVGWTSAGRRYMRTYPYPTSSRRRAEVGPTSDRRRHADAEMPTSPRRRADVGMFTGIVPIILF